MNKKDDNNKIKKYPNFNWVNDIELTYEIKLMPESKKTLEEAADDMITGVTIGTVQESEGVYTTKANCVFGPNPGAFKGEIVEIKQTNDRGGFVKVSFSSEIAQTQEIGFAGLLSVAAGDGLGTAYEMQKVRLIDLKLPENVVKTFPGPKFGQEGIRKLIKKDESKYPLVALLLKPNTGQPSDHYARLAKEAGLCGVNYIKEDEIQFNHFICPLIDRAKKILQALNEVEEITGQKIIYAPNITARSQNKIIENAKRVIELGASAVMINVMQVGLDSLRVLREANLDVPIHIHRAGHDSYSRGDVGIDLFVLSKLFRLGGADLIHVGPVFGGLYDPESVIKNVRALSDDWFELQNSFPILSRSTINVVQDSIDYLATDLNIKSPANVIFLVDKYVYQNAEPLTGSISEPLKRFVEVVKNTEINRKRTKEEILKKQGFSL